YHRVFNPVTQGRKFDPAGDYVRRYVPELRSVDGPAVHAPWELPDGPPGGYPERIVDHAAARAEALAPYQKVRRQRVLDPHPGTAAQHRSRVDPPGHPDQRHRDEDHEQHRRADLPQRDVAG